MSFACCTGTRAGSGTDTRTGAGVGVRVGLDALFATGFALACGLITMKVRSMAASSSSGVNGFGR
jgi:hypothetical protein